MKQISLHNATIKYMTEIYEVLNGKNGAHLSDFMITELLKQNDHELIEWTIQRNKEKYAVTFCVNDYDTNVSIDYENNITVNEIIDYNGTEQKMAVADYDGKEFLIVEIDLEDL